jgi:uncharacterized protein (TIRG00374 family)
MLLSISLLAALLAFGNLGNIAHAIRHFHPIFLLFFLALMTAYEAVRCGQWRFMLHVSGIETTTRTAAFTFLVGEMAKTLPMGQYLRNYLLRQARGANVGQTAPATLTTLLIEDAVSLVGVLMLGISGWAWLRPLVVVSALAFMVAIVALYRLVVTARMPRRITTSGRFRALLDEVKLFKQSTALLASPRTLLVQFAFGAAYLLLGAGGLYMLLLGLGITSVPLTQAVSVYFFSLACGLLIPIPVDIGLIELSGTTALLAIGIKSDLAVSAMLLNRVLGGAVAVLIALVTMVVLRRDLRAALRNRDEVPATPAAGKVLRPVRGPAMSSRPLADGGRPAIASPRRQRY